MCIVYLITYLYLDECIDSKALMYFTEIKKELWNKLYLMW